MNYKKRPETIAELKRRLDGYFKSRLSVVTDKNGEATLDDKGKPLTRISLPYTLTGLALSLGLEKREDLFSFEDPEMQRYINMSVLKIEEYAEERLFSKEAFSGVKLFLEVNFDRWRDGEDCDGDEGEYQIPEALGKWTV